MKPTRIFLIIIIAAAVVLIGPQVLDYVAAMQAIPEGVTMGGVQVQGATAAEAAQRLRDVFERPVLVYHGKERIVLRAEDIGFLIDAEEMVGEAQSYGEGLFAVRDFFLDALERPALGGDVQLQYDYDRAKLGTWLQQQSDAYDNDPTPAYGKLDTLTFVPGQPGRYSDLNESAINILRAFTDPVNREAEMVLRETSPLPPTFETLEDALEARLQRFAGIYSLYFQHLETGEVIDIDGDTAFAAMSAVKIPILLKLYYDYDFPLDDTLTNWISVTVRSETASNAAANALMYHIGGSDTMQGTRDVTEFMRELGFENTFMSIPYDSNLRPGFVRTPANTNPEYNTYPDPAMQTTPADVGEVLAEIGYCAEGKGNLLAAYPEQLSQEECQDLVGWLEQNPMGFLIKYGVPKDTRIGHKHGYGTDTQGDVAIVYGPEGPYVLSIFVYQSGWVVWDQSNPLMNDLSRLIWNFFLYRAGEEQLPPFEETEETAEDTPG